MARASTKQVEEQPELEVLPVVESVTYVPSHGDPSHVVWCGYTFHANVAKEIKGHAAGTEREKLNAHLIDRARDNPSFKVGNAKAARSPAKQPSTAEEYRVYFVEWLKHPSIQHAEDMITRLANDREIQHVCGVGTDDFDFMRDLFMPKLHDLAKQDEMTAQHLSDCWIRHGFNQLPW
jgi:hypothetical protein